MDNKDVDDPKSGDEIDVSKLPPVEECERRCQEFAKITNTDVACAQFYMQDRHWDLEASIVAYFDENENILKRPASPSAGNGTKRMALETGTLGRRLDRVKIASWNIDGLDERNMLPRACAVAKKILDESADVILLQEVVPANEVILREKLQDRYTILTGGDKNYYTAMLFKRDSIKFIELHTVDFKMTQMERNLLVAKVELKSIGLPFMAMTTHLESCKEHSAIRVQQLRTVFGWMRMHARKQPVFCGGDFNVRDSEVAEVGLPDGIVDLWESTGSRPEARYTWDLRRNTNLQMSGQARLRFDRLYFAAPPEKSPPGFFTPLYFELIGLEKVPLHQVFPSDHWGILVHVNVDELKAVKNDAEQNNEDSLSYSDKDPEGEVDGESNDCEGEVDGESNDCEGEVDGEIADCEVHGERNNCEGEDVEKKDVETDTAEK